MRRSLATVAATGLAAALVAAGGVATVTMPAAAAAGCKVTYTIVSQWGGGFQGDVAITNLGDPVGNWKLEFDFPNSGQKIASGWNATWTQSGTRVTATSLSYNGSIPTNGTASGMGFTATITGANPVPTTFWLNGAMCGGPVTLSPTPTPTATPTVSPSPTPSPTPTPTPTPTPSPTPTVTPTTGTPRPGVGPCTPGATYPNPLPSSSVTATKIRDGFNFLEGPVWDSASQTLLLSLMRDGTGSENVQPSDVLRFTEPNTFQTFISGSGSNGLALSRDGATLLAATHDQRSVSSFRLSDRTRGVVASNYQGRAFNSPNDLTVGADGTVYFTDPDFQRANRSDQMSGRTGVFRVKNGVVSLIDDTIREPNGIALSPDGKTLYVGGNGTGKIYKWPVNSDGSVGTRADFASLNGSDGVTIDCAGNLYQASFNDGKVYVYAPSGVQLGTISAGQNTTNLAFGGPDGQTLYITSGTPSRGGNTGNFGLYRVRLNVPGWPY
ncbi:SMP-30/gluconolactonase/LRE family protein [Microbispora sp. NBC_01189]|uniref:SMP-30/gluconolactonase/LRE family protein n=1 Tax=Microbispora sp. NBC_01189 TaxID=2903583 RepID=UPI002E126B64|nr:SMP-30/gluconolactonase/LRE family protein [Microbispora sp. NBC_01189]